MAPVPGSEAVRLARELWGLDVEARSLPGEYDSNFHVTVGEGPGFVLKVMHPERERGLVELQCDALRHLAARAPHLALPRVRLTTRGDTVASVELGGDRRLAWMLTYVPGTVLARARPHSPELLGSLGGLLGEMDAALGDFSHPAAERELKWDLARAGWIRGHLTEIDGQPRRALVERIPHALRDRGRAVAAASSAERHPRRRQRPQRHRREPTEVAAGGRERGRLR